MIGHAQTRDRRIWRPAAAYQASQIRCHRLTRAEVEARREARVHRGQTRANQRMGFTDPADQASDTRSRGFGDVSVELDAIEPNRLRALVQEAIERHLPQEQFEVLKAAEESEREIISRLVGKIAP